MILGIDASRAYAPQKTGVEWYTYFVIEELKKMWQTNPELYKKIQVILYIHTPPTSQCANLPIGWSVKHLKWPPKKYWTQARLSFEMLFHTPDILWIPAHVMPLIHPKNTVMTVHDISAIEFPQSYSWFEQWYSLWSVRFALRHARHIITPSAYTKQQITEFFGTQFEKNITPIAHGYSPEYATKKDAAETNRVLKKYGIQKPYILTIGRQEYKKNTARLIQAFTEVQNTYPQTVRQLVCIGKPGYGYEAVQQAIDTSPYKQDILLPGWVEQEDVPYILSAAEVFVFPSLSEGFGIPVLEAMGSGVPVVTSQHSSMAEIAGNDTLCFVDPLSVASIAAGIFTMIDDAPYRTKCIQNGHERAKQFSWHATAERTLSALIGE
ncbi:MAG: glycosyltransferase family 4 protein [Candidatus Magasanikbacteria bacterium]|jgi:glycosyltransferase involved in cell wall biosynthesis|nr:glycosyltransferase family 4 protein [Candidatus Magasanikbacteria bacterium]